MEGRERGGEFVSLKIGSVRFPKPRYGEGLKKSCVKCGGRMAQERGSDYYQDGVETYDLLRCVTCGFEERINVEWEGMPC